MQHYLTNFWQAQLGIHNITVIEFYINSFLRTYRIEIRLSNRTVMKSYFLPVHSTYFLKYFSYDWIVLRFKVKATYAKYINWRIIDLIWKLRLLLKKSQNFRWLFQIPACEICPFPGSCKRSHILIIWLLKRTFAVHLVFIIF